MPERAPEGRRTPTVRRPAHEPDPERVDELLDADREFARRLGRCWREPDGQARGERGAPGHLRSGGVGRPGIDRLGSRGDIDSMADNVYKATPEQKADLAYA